MFSKTPCSHAIGKLNVAPVFPAQRRTTASPTCSHINCSPRATNNGTKKCKLSMLGVQNRGHSQPEFQNHTLCISNRNASGVINGHFMEAWNPLVGWNQRPMKTTWRHAKKQKPWRGHDIEMIWSVGLLRVNLKIFYIQGCRVSTWLPDHSRSPSCVSPQLHKIVGLHAVCCPHACIYSSCKCSFSFKLHQTMHACFYASACTQFFFGWYSWIPDSPWKNTSVN